MPTAPVHSSAESALSAGHPVASSKAKSRGASPARSTKWARPSARSANVRTTSVAGVGMAKDNRADRPSGAGAPGNHSAQAPERPDRLRGQLAPLHLHDPEPRVHVGNVDVSVPVDRAPGVGDARGHALFVRGDDMRDLSALGE